MTLRSGAPSFNHENKDFYLYLVFMTKKVRFTRERVASYLTRLQALVIKSYESTQQFDFRLSVSVLLEEFQRYLDVTGKPFLHQLCIEDSVLADADPSVADAEPTKFPTEADVYRSFIIDGLS